MIKRNILLIAIASLIIIAPAYSLFPFHGPSITAESDVITPVGVFWYQWYGYNYSTSSWSGGFKTSHWNDSSNAIVTDAPLIGYYASLSNQTIAWQISEMQSAGITFAILSWWGWGVTNFSSSGQNQSAEAINSATLNVFRYVEANDPNFKLAIMVDAFTNASLLTASNYAEIYSYVAANFTSQFPSIYFKWQGNPLLCWFNPMNPAAQSSLNSSFTNRVVGNSQGVNWTLWQAPSWTLQGNSGINVTQYEGNPNISSDGVVSVIPRYDDYMLYNYGGRNSFMRFDVSYNESLYQQEWNYVLDHRSNVSMVLIYSWNEYHERSVIEPHYDNTSSASPSYLLDLTGFYTTRLNSPSIPGASKFYFSDSKAIDFYLSLSKTGLGLLRDYPGASVIHLADDQALDYYALNDTYVTTLNSTAISVAYTLNSSMSSWGSLFKYWNPVFEVLNQYPSSPSPQNGSDFIIGTQNGYTINATEYTPNPSFNYSQYSDQLAYRVLLELHVGNYSTAETLFRTLNSTWDGKGFADLPFHSGNENGTYQSYKLALYEIVWNAMQTSPPTRYFAWQFIPTAANVSLIMSELQSPENGGVWTGYRFTNNHIEFGPVVSTQNGETTSLFVLATGVPASPPPPLPTVTSSTTSSSTASSSFSTTISNSEVSTTLIPTGQPDLSIWIALIAATVILVPVAIFAISRRR